MKIQYDNTGMVLEPKLHDAWLQTMTHEDKTLRMSFAGHHLNPTTLEINSVHYVIANEFRIHNIIFDFDIYKLQGEFLGSPEEFQSEIDQAAEGFQHELARAYQETPSILIFTGSYGGTIFVLGNFLPRRFKLVADQPMICSLIALMSFTRPNLKMLTIGPWHYPLVGALVKDQQN